MERNLGSVNVSMGKPAPTTVASAGNAGGRRGAGAGLLPWLRELAAWGEEAENERWRQEAELKVSSSSFAGGAGALLRVDNGSSSLLCFSGNLTRR